MFDIGWSEILVIAIVLIVVVGPKDLPPMIRAFGKTMAGLRKMAGDFRTQFDEALKEADMDDVRQTIADAKKLNPANSLREAINPLRQLGQEIKSDLNRATSQPATATPVDLLKETPVTVPEPAMTLPETRPVIATATPQVDTAPVVAAAPVKVARKPAVKKPAAKKPAVAVEKPVVATVEKPVAVKPKRAKPVAASVSVPVETASLTEVAAKAATPSKKTATRKAPQAVKTTKKDKA
jgi:sec-independent protein translocase protein TatB